MLRTTLAVLSGLAASAAALDPIEAYGNKFFDKDGSQFFIKGRTRPAAVHCYAVPVADLCRCCVPACSR